MNRLEAKQTIAAIREIAGRPGISDRKTLDLILREIKNIRCFCDRSWRRGGQRRGSALCDACWK